MCGISGVFAQKITEQDARLINAVVKSQHRRGPDHSACETIQSRSAEAVFGHNRLSILDLSSRANQPMWDQSGRFCITYNGEIYNYIELKNELEQEGYPVFSASDTGVILAAFARWGVDAVNRFNGPFALAIFDRETDLLYLFRDRFGVRPLYYIETDKKFYFASSTAVFAREFHLKSNLNWLARGIQSLAYENGEADAPWEGVRVLQAGHGMTVNVLSSGRLSVSVTKYYDPAERVLQLIESLPVDNMNELTAQVEHTFQQAVRVRLRSDVPLGVTLSSGLDSSAVAAIASHSGQKITGFSFGSPANSKSEGVLAKQCAAFLGIPMEYVDPGPEALVDAFFETIGAQEAPFSSLSIVAQYLLYKHINQCGVKVILGGQGGDEAFMGYRKYILFRLKSLLNKKEFNTAIPEFIKFIPAMCAELTSFKTYWRHRHRYRKSANRQTTITLPTTVSPNLGMAVGQSLWNRQLDDITTWSLPTLLRYEDRNAMGNGVESRLPFMDYQVIELGLALPVAVKLRHGYAKWPVRQMMKGKIPDTIRMARYKRGFDLPLQPVVSAGLGRRIREELIECKDALQSFLVPGVNIQTAFSDGALLQRAGCFAEAIALLWIRRFC